MPLYVCSRKDGKKMPYPWCTDEITIRLGDGEQAANYFAAALGLIPHHDPPDKIRPGYSLDDVLEAFGYQYHGSDDCEGKCMTHREDAELHEADRRYEHEKERAAQ